VVQFEVSGDSEAFVVQLLSDSGPDAVGMEDNSAPMFWPSMSLDPLSFKGSTGDC
jgi:hypothetical protein